MKKLISAILILLLFLGIYSCGKDDSASTDNSTASSPSVILYAYSSSNSYDADDADGVANTCYGTNSSGYTSAPFYSTSIHDLKDRLPSSKWSYPVKSLQGHVISTSWENLWDGNIDMSLHKAEVIYDNYSSSSAAAGGTGFWTGTKSDGTFSGNDCTGWSSRTSADNATAGSLQFKDSSRWIDNDTKGCNTSSNTYFLCFKYN